MGAASRLGGGLVGLVLSRVIVPLLVMQNFLTSRYSKIRACQMGKYIGKTSAILGEYWQDQCEAEDRDTLYAIKVLEFDGAKKIQGIGTLQAMVRFECIDDDAEYNDPEKPMWMSLDMFSKFHSEFLKANPPPAPAPMPAPTPTPAEGTAEAGDEPPPPPGVHEGHRADGRPLLLRDAAVREDRQGQEQRGGRRDLDVQGQLPGQPALQQE